MPQSPIAVVNPDVPPRVGTCAIALAALVSIAYANSLTGPFIFDDVESIIESPHVRSIWPLSEAMKALPQSSVSGRPLVSFTLALNFAISGHNVWSWHAFNILAHLLAAWTLFGIVRRTLQQPRLAQRFGHSATMLAFWTASVWALHPLNTSAVTYVIQRAEVLVGLFYLLTLYAVIRSAERSASRIWPLVAIVACAAGMATKEVMVTAPVVVLLYDRTFLSGSFLRTLRDRTWLYVGLAASWLLLAALNINGPRSQSAGFGITNITPTTYALTQFAVITHYLKLVFWPAKLCLDYQWPFAQHVREVLPQLLFIGSLAIVTLHGVIRNRMWGFCGAWFFIILSPTSSFVPLVDAAFEHRMYLPIAGVVSLFIIGLYPFIARPSITIPVRHAKPVTVLLAIICLTCLTRTGRRNEDFTSAESIWRSVLAVRPENPRAHVNLATILDRAGAIDEAASHYQKAIESGSFSAHALANYGDLLRRLGRLDEALIQLRRAINAKPDFAPAHINLANTLLALNRPDEAIAAYRTATRLTPHSHIAWYNLGIALHKNGQPADALTPLSRALELQPEIPEISHARGLVLLDLHRPVDALNDFHRAASQNPQWPSPLDRAAWIFATSADPAIRNPAKALELARRAVQLSAGRNARHLDTLAAAQAAMGDFSSAIESAAQALQLARKGDEPSPDEIQSRLLQYQARRPFLRDIPNSQPTEPGD